MRSHAANGVRKPKSEENNAPYSATAPALALIARLGLLFFCQCSPRGVMKHDAITLPLTPRGDNLIATFQQLCDDSIE